MNQSAESSEEAVQPTTAALIFEFDHLVARVREATFEILKKMFDGEGLTPVHFSRFGLVDKPSKMIQLLQKEFGVKKGTPKKLSDELMSGIQAHLETGNVQVTDALRDVVVQARERSMPVYALTSLPVALRDALGERLDLNGLGIEFMPFGTGMEPYPRADAWLTLCKDHDVFPPRSLAIVTDMAGLKSALTTGFHCVVVPDPFTDFQDFGGAQAVVDSPKDITLAEYLVQPFAKA